jgi:murein DD-endopeptidase MepM/ murein hydrolase activator NlpD
MPEDHYPEGYTGASGAHQEPDVEPDSPSGSQGAGKRENRLLLIWEGLSRTRLGETVFRVGTHMLSIALVLVVVWAMRAFYLRAQENDAPDKAVLAAELPTPVPTEAPPALPIFNTSERPLDFGIARLTVMHTNLPARPRGEVITYEVQPGDTIFGIAEQFNLNPQTILWGNFYLLGDNPHLLSPGQELNILPIDGTYHKWSAGEGLNGVAAGYRVTPEVIINWPGNRLTQEMVADPANPTIEPGTWLVVPGGERDFITWSAPRINRDNPAVARVLGPGSCGTIVDGAVGTGTFIWPANEHRLSGYDYSPATNHFGIDIAGGLGDPIYAADNGVIVYAGWNNWGYGNVIVIDHGYGWQTLYAHLSYVGVSCGQSVYQGNVIGSNGSTGNSSGPHLHFEMLHESYGKVNPWNFLP